MKQFILSLIVTMILSMVGIKAHADFDFHDIVKIGSLDYFLDYDNNTAGVTREMPGEYSGDIVVPSNIDYNGKNYKVTHIFAYAFDRCENLKSVTISEGVTTIYTAAFFDCNGLSDIIFPKSLSVLRDYIAINCPALTNVFIPEGVTEIGLCPFEQCPGIKSVIVDKANKKFDSREDCNAIISTELNQMIFGCQNTIIPSSVTSIGPWAFEKCSELQTLVIPQGVTSIGELAFAGCEGLVSVTIPNSVSSIGKQAFEYCRSMSSITIPEGVTAIEDNTFTDCFSLSLVVLPNSLTGIGSNTFHNCPFSTIDIPNSVTSIGESAFSSCSNLSSINLPNSLIAISDNVFNSCTNLVSIYIPVSVNDICVNAFYGCSNLNSITVDSGNNTYDSRDNCNAIIRTSDNTLVLGCKKTVIPDGIISIGDQAFNYCTDLRAITLPNSVTTIGNGAFYNCKFLNEVVMGSEVKSLGNYVFSGCMSLNDIYCYAQEAPATGYDLFTGIIMENGIRTLHVPAESVDEYKKAKNWRLFKSIVALTAYDPAPTSIKSIVNDNQGDNTWYDLNGRKLSSEPSAKGLYIKKGKKVIK